MRLNALQLNDKLTKYTAILIDNYATEVQECVDRETTDIIHALQEARIGAQTKCMDEFSGEFADSKPADLVDKYRHRLEMSVCEQNVTFETLCKARVANGDQLVDELSEKFTHLLHRKLDDNFLFMTEQKELYTYFNDIYGRFTAKCEYLCASDQYCIDGNQLAEYLLKRQTVIDLFQEDYYLCEKFGELTATAVDEYKQKIAEINTKNAKYVQNYIQMGKQVYEKQMSNLLKSGTFSDETFREQHNALLDNIWVKMAYKLSTKQIKQSVIRECKQQLELSMEPVYHAQLALNQQIHELINNLMTEMLYKLHEQYCQQFAARLSQTPYLDRCNFNQVHTDLVSQLWPRLESIVFDQKTRFTDKYLWEILGLNRVNIELNVDEAKEKYWALNERKRNKSNSLIVSFADTPTGAYYDRPAGAILNVLDAHNTGRLATNSLAFDGKRILYGAEAERYLNGAKSHIIDIMGRDVSDDELYNYEFRFVDKNHLKIRLIYGDEANTSLELNVESLLALQTIEMKTAAERQFDSPMLNTLFVVPTGYTIRQLNAVRDSATIAGIEHAHFITEMSAAAIDFGFNTSNYDRNLAYREVLIVIFARNICELALVEYIDDGMRYKAYKCVPITGQTPNEMYNFVNKKLPTWLASLFKYVKYSKVFDGLVIGDYQIASKINFEKLPKKYCTRITFNCVMSAIITRGAVFYSDHYETHRKPIPISGVYLRDIMCCIVFNDNIKYMDTLVRANETPGTCCYQKFKLPSTCKLPIFIFIMDGPETVIKQYIIHELNKHVNLGEDLYLFITMCSDTYFATNYEFTIHGKIAPKYISNVPNEIMTEVHYNLTQEQLGEQKALVAKLRETDDLINWPLNNNLVINDDDEITDYVCNYYTSVKYIKANVPNVSDSMEITPINECKEIIAREPIVVSADYLDTFINKLADSYTEQILTMMDSDKFVALDNEIIAIFNELSADLVNESQKQKFMSQLDEIITESAVKYKHVFNGGPQTLTDTDISDNEHRGNTGEGPGLTLSDTSKTACRLKRKCSSVCRKGESKQKLDTVNPTTIEQVLNTLQPDTVNYVGAVNTHVTDLDQPMNEMQPIASVAAKLAHTSVVTVHSHKVVAQAKHHQAANVVANDHDGNFISTAVIDEFTRFAAGIRDRLDLHNVFHTKKSRILDQLKISETIVRSDTNRFDEQKGEILAMIKKLKLSAKLITVYTALAIVNEPWMWSIMGDSFYSWGSGRAMYAMMACFCCTVYGCRTSITMHELDGKLECIPLISGVKVDNRNQQDTLNVKYFTKYCLKVKFYTKLITPGVVCGVVPSIAAHVITSIMCYKGWYGVTDHSLFSLVLANLSLTLWMTNATYMGFGYAFVLHVLIIGYMKYIFRQINDSLAIGTRYGNALLVREAIARHQKWTVVVEKSLAFVNEPWMWSLMGDSFYSWGSGRAIYTIVICCVTPSITAHAITSIMCYQGRYGVADHSLIFLTLSNITLAVWIINATYMGFAYAFALQVLTVGYMRYIFRQINDSLTVATRFGRNIVVLKAIARHQ
ncbi:unnamed protein product, partial [Medioppia subpectinata]